MKALSAKTFLSQAFTVQRLINAKESRIQDLRDKQERIGQMNTAAKVKTSPKSDWMGEITAKLVDLIADCQRDYQRLLSIQREIETVINTVERADYRLILFERYINLKPWDRIATDNGYGEKHVFKIHGRALLAVKLIPNDT
jgi:hypothetical protein